MGKQSDIALLKLHYPLLKHMSTCKPSECQHILKASSDQFIRLMSKICINVMNKSLVRNSDEAVRKLAPYKKELRAVTRNKVTTKKKREVLQQKGGFIGALLSVALPLLTSLISSVTRR